MCGILAVLLASQNNVASEIAEGLQLLQHRGQDACGVVTCGPKGRFYQCKGNGMVRDLLDAKNLSQLIGGMGVGHARYPTAGSSAQSEAQPFYVNSPYGLVFAHNGNLINTDHLRYYLDHYAHRHINTSSDSELLLNLLADALQKTGKFRIDEDDIFRAIREVMQMTSGGYACTAMIAGYGIFGFRDPNGIRPMGWAKRKSETVPGGFDYMMASESVVCDALGYSDWTDIKPGEAIIVTQDGVKTMQCTPARTFAPDVFEYVYFARPDSVVDGISVYRARMAMGDALAATAKAQLDKAGIKVDVVIPVPDTSRVAALQLAQNLNIPYREGFVKNRYVGRTFIMPGQELRRKNVRRKLNAMALEFAGKNVMIVDDSIVRGTTSKEIIVMAREAGAKKVIMASCAPPIRYPCVYGIDMPSRHELVAHDRTEDEIAEYIGADHIIFQSLDDLVSSCQRLNPSIERFECSVFNGEYVTGGVDEAYLSHIEGLRNDNAKRKAGQQGAGPALVNINGANASNVVLASQPLGDVTGGGEVAGGGDISQVVGLSNENAGEAKESPSIVVGLDNQR
ncbi:Amidophosphoribosyltransferase [Rhodotorula toruloides]|uniref:Amidophosphoribosyltransferase n=1 Tax=Rhodotorula toruloides TaxID=5286 RepID=A0A0K3CG77_RHOTO|nr:Amidophosphoribosyltransferase [Rhodotorula toruloides]PRQ73733.1 Phosphoribosyltransferase-like protein [Rhodotorula toruloides]